jgi:hypothetical protein
VGESEDMGIEETGLLGWQMAIRPPDLLHILSTAA